jgi:methylenetetrahydrofolate dehydrogenase (NADP+)/methenyltetrahydrofolate cyclohydrolase
MEPVLLDGRSVAADVLAKLRIRLARTGRSPRLALLRVGEDPASQIYVKRKCAVAAELGIQTLLQIFPETASAGEVLDRLAVWNGDDSIDAILVQAPLPTRNFQERVFAGIDPTKDVDGFHPHNFGLLAQGRPGGFVPCTAKGIVHLLRAWEVPLAGRHVVILGRSLIVGLPLALLLQSRSVDATVTLCHSRSANVRDLTRSAEILISATGRAHSIGPEDIREGSVVVDVGQDRLPDSGAPGGLRLCGDVDFASVRGRCSHITPVPGGVGPMTIAMLMENVVEAYENRHR